MDVDRLDANRRAALKALASIPMIPMIGALGGCGQRSGNDLPPMESAPPRVEGSGMRQRKFGRTGMSVSEVGFGSWAIGGGAYGSVERSESLRALARAEELGCNFVDTAMVYGDSEAILGEFLESRRSRWVVATKYSGQAEGMERTLEKQLQALRTDAVDFYQIHWAPSAEEGGLYESLYRLKKAGKARFVGISLKTARDIDNAIDHTSIDGFQVPMNLLAPQPFVGRLEKIRASGLGIIVRSALREGFLTGKFQKTSRFTDPGDQRSKLSEREIADLVDAVEKFRFLEAETASMAVAAARYPLSFPEVSVVILGTKSPAQADVNFGKVPGATLSPQSLARVEALQRSMGLMDVSPRWLERLKRLLR